MRTVERTLGEAAEAGVEDRMKRALGEAAEAVVDNLTGRASGEVEYGQRSVECRDSSVPVSLLVLLKVELFLARCFSLVG